MPLRRISDMSRREYASVEEEKKLGRKGGRGSKRAGPGGITGRVAQQGPRPDNTPPQQKPGLNQVKAKEPKSPTEKRAEKREEQMVLRRLSGGQAKLDKNKNNKIDAEDFKMLRAEKGTPMKANKGLLSEAKKKFPGLKKADSAADYLKRRQKLTGKGKTDFDTKFKAQQQGFINKKTGAGRKDFMERAKSVKLGKRLLVPIALGIGAVQYLKGKVKKKEEKNKKTLQDFRERKKPGFPSEKTKMINKALTKKMGGGMMQRPMGMGSYKKGTMIKARGGGIARSKPTKMY
jgi:hypothetical protein